MTGPLAEARQALTGVIEMLAGKPDFHGRFDVSMRGLIGSFQAAILAIPFVAVAAMAQRTLAARTLDEIGGGLAPYSTAFVLVRFLADWAYFPLFAALITTLLRRKSGFAPWVVLTNWSQLAVRIAETAPLALLVAGLDQAGAFLIVVIAALTVYAAVLAARAALQVSWPIAIPAGCAAVATILLIDAGLMRVML
jgi:hypothetical protein